MGQGATVGSSLVEPDFADKSVQLIGRAEKAGTKVLLPTDHVCGEQISDSMIQLNETAHQTADSLRQSNQSIQQLKDAANGLQTAVSIFKVRKNG